MSTDEAERFQIYRINVSTPTKGVITMPKLPTLLSQNQINGAFDFNAMTTLRERVWINATLTAFGTDAHFHFTLCDDDPTSIVVLVDLPIVACARKFDMEQFDFLAWMKERGIESDSGLDEPPYLCFTLSEAYTLFSEGRD